MIELAKATSNQIRYSCKNYHYANKVPSVQIAYSCYEDNEFIGVIIYSGGANNNLAKKFNLVQGQIMELVRVALNGKQKSPTSKFVAISMKLIKKHKPLVRLLVSYADTAQNHKGTIYKATNWQFDGESLAESVIDPETGEVVHARSMHSKYGSIKGFTRVKDKPKLRYIYWIKRQEHENNATVFHTVESGAVPTLAHQQLLKTVKEQ